MNTVVPPPPNDGSQPGPSFVAFEVIPFETTDQKPVRHISEQTRDYPPTACPKCGGDRFWRKVGHKMPRPQFRPVCLPCHRDHLARQRKKFGGAAARNKAWEKNNRIKAIAHRKVETHLKNGNIVRKPCERCGSHNSQAHHDDYTHALEVMWLCPEHHAERHRELKMSSADSSPAEAIPAGSRPKGCSDPAGAIPSWNDILDAYEAKVRRLPLGHETPSRGCSTYDWKMSVLRELREMFEATDQAFPTPQASSPRLRETQALNAGDCVPPSSIDPAFFAAWRESQGTTIDAEPRVSR